MTAKKRKPYDPESCTRCVDYFCAHPMLVEACASVGIEHDRSTADMLHAYLRDFHERGHKE